MTDVCGGLDKISINLFGSFLDIQCVYAVQSRTLKKNPKEFIHNTAHSVSLPYIASLSL